MGTTPATARLQLKGFELSERNQMVMEQLPQVRFIAQKIHARLPHHIPLEDLVNTGVLGLIEALAKFDPKRNVQLQSYARYRIQGAILDSLREQDWSPRLLRQKGRQLEAAREKLQTQLGRAPSQTELADAMGVTDHQLQLLLRDLQGLEVASLQEPTSLEGHSLDEKMADTAEESPFVLCERAEMNGLLAKAMSKLPPRKRQALDLYYFKGLTMKETGNRMGVCESRVSQIHSSAVASLKARMKEVLIAQQREEECAGRQPLASPVTILPCDADQYHHRTASPELASTLSDIPTSVQRRRRAGSESRKPKRLSRATPKNARKRT
ncbi:MAG TPA: FliA/WhiG family RNA polymerase sigma factor [Terriglobia bacterium]|nr:FliA/WhiG family RNA polymerase sigma factor [Terriglobia bacterium]